jgi:single-stranded-DNA-specific exonuclease
VCADLLLCLGGHTLAAGVSLRPSEIGEFRTRFNDVVGAAVPEFVPTLEIDAAVTLGEITTKLVEEIEGLAPFGYGNPQPVLGARGLEVASARIVGNNHLRLRLRHRGNMLDAIGFDMGGMLAELEDAHAVDAAFSVSINEWEGRRNPQLQIRAMREYAG